MSDDSWDYAEAVDFVTEKRAAGHGARAGLLRAASTPLDTNYPNIFVTYYSLPDWLVTYSQPGPSRFLASSQPHFKRTAIRRRPFLQLVTNTDSQRINISRTSSKHSRRSAAARPGRLCSERSPPISIAPFRSCRTTIGRKSCCPARSTPRRGRFSQANLGYVSDGLQR